jgi:hypothetical protein
MDPNAANVLRDHLERFFVGHGVERREFNGRHDPAHLSRISRSPRRSRTQDEVVVVHFQWRRERENAGRPVSEFLVVSQQNDPECVERLAMIVRDHHNRTLGPGERSRWVNRGSTGRH